MVNNLRKLLWKFLGINFYNFLKNKKHTNLKDAEWLDIIWGDAIYQAAKETGLEDFPETCSWAVEDILAQDWLP